MVRDSRLARAMSCFLRWNALSAALAVLPRVRHAEPSERLFNALALDEPLANVLLGALLGARVPGADFDAHIARSRVFGAALVEGLREGRLVRGDGSYARSARIKESARDTRIQALGGAHRRGCFGRHGGVRAEGWRRVRVTERCRGFAGRGCRVCVSEGAGAP